MLNGAKGTPPRPSGGGSQQEAAAYSGAKNAYSIAESGILRVPLVYVQSPHEHTQALRIPEGLTLLGLQSRFEDKLLIT